MPISSLPGANPLPPEHKNSIFVLFWPSRPSFSGFSSTKSGVLCAFAGRWSPTCGRRLRKEGIHTGHDARIAGTMPELRARCQNCGGVGRNKKAPAVPEPSMYVCCVRVIVVEYVSTRTCDVYTFLYTFPYARTFVLCTFALLHLYACTFICVCWWRWRDSNPRPTKPSKSFLHA